MQTQQQEIEISGPGVSRVKIDDIEQAAQKYVTIRDQRMALTEQEITLKVNLIQTVLAHQDQLVTNEDGNKCYHFDEMIVVLKPGKPNVKVKRDPEGDADDDDGDED